jgi:hypothetical protein
MTVVFAAAMHWELFRLVQLPIVDWIPHIVEY